MRSSAMAGCLGALNGCFWGFGFGVWEFLRIRGASCKDPLVQIINPKPEIHSSCSGRS